MMGFEVIALWSDILIWLLVAAGIGVGVMIARNPPLLAAWRRVGANRVGMASATVLLAFILIGLLDSLHYRVQLTASRGRRQSMPLRFCQCSMRSPRPAPAE
jgi:peptide/nickel transport system permease protein